MRTEVLRDLMELVWTVCKGGDTTGSSAFISFVCSVVSVYCVGVEEDDVLIINHKKGQITGR